MSVPDQHFLGKSPTKVDFVCVTMHCAKEMAEAMVEPTFIKMTECENSCNPLYYNDTTPMKLHYQNCTTKCALTYETPEIDNFMTCAMNNDCMSFAIINDTVCPSPEIDPESSIASLEGEWW